MNFWIKVTVALLSLQIIQNHSFHFTWWWAWVLNQCCVRKILLEMDIGPVKGRQSKSLPAKSKRKKLCHINETRTFRAMCLVYWYLLASLWYKFKPERGKFLLFFVHLVFLCWRLSFFGTSILPFLACFSVLAPLFLLMLFDIVHYNGLPYFSICCWYARSKLRHLQRNILLYWGYAKYIFLTNSPNIWQNNF